MKNKKLLEHSVRDAAFWAPIVGKLGVLAIALMMVVGGISLRAPSVRSILPFMMICFVIYIVISMANSRRPVNREEAKRIKLTEEFPIDGIQSDKIRSYLDRALNVRLALGKSLLEERKGSIPDGVFTIVRNTDDLVARLYQFACQIDPLVLERDQVSAESDMVARRVLGLSARFRNMTDQDSQVVQAAQQVMDSLANHGETNKHLLSMLDVLELQLEQAVINLETQRSQVNLMSAKQVNHRIVSGVNTALKAQTDELGDLLSAMEEVYNGDYSELDDEVDTDQRYRIAPEVHSGGGTHHISG